MEGKKLKLSYFDTDEQNILKLIGLVKQKEKERGLSQEEIDFKYTHGFCSALANYIRESLSKCFGFDTGMVSRLHHCFISHNGASYDILGKKSESEMFAFLQRGYFKNGQPLFENKNIRKGHVDSEEMKRWKTYTKKMLDDLVLSVELDEKDKDKKIVIEENDGPVEVAEKLIDYARGFQKMSGVFESDYRQYVTLPNCKYSQMALTDIVKTLNNLGFKNVFLEEKDGQVSFRVEQNGQEPVYFNLNGVIQNSKEDAAKAKQYASIFKNSNLTAAAKQPEKLQSWGTVFQMMNVNMVKNSSFEPQK